MVMISWLYPFDRFDVVSISKESHSLWYYWYYSYALELLD